MTDGVLKEHKKTMLFLERRIPDGRTRYGIVGKIDLEEYDYRPGTRSAIRATEQTVLERIPPRVAIRRGASLELPHVMMLYDDAERELEKVLCSACSDKAPLYEFPLMMGGGAVKGTVLSQKEADYVSDWFTKRQHTGMALAVGDGNHSLAAAKALYEELKATVGEETARNHPARYALCELVNIYSDALDFTPIHRLLKHVDADAFLRYLASFAQKGGENGQTVLRALKEGEPLTVTVPVKEGTLSVGVLQDAIDAFLSENGGTVDYIHGDDALRALASQKNTVGIFCEPIDKANLFDAVKLGGALPRKTFSMGISREKRYYIEARKIR